MSPCQRLASLLLLSSLPILAQTPVPATPSPLNGVWHITGNHEKKQFPQLSISLQLNGSQLVAHGWFQLKCSGTQISGDGRNFGISGTLAPDGTFTLATPADSRADIHITLSGHAPSLNAYTWSGT